MPLDLFFVFGYNLLVMINFLFQLILFTFVSILVFVVPGNLFWRKIQTKVGFWEEFILSLSIGFVSFSLLSYVLLYFKIDYLCLPITILINLLWVKTYLLAKVIRFSFLQKIPQYISNNILYLLIFGVGILGQLAVISPSGIYLNGDLVFWSAHGHDVSWHIALSEELKKGFPLQNPVYAGEKLVNYHFFSDLSMAMFNKYFGINMLDLYFRFFPLIYSILLGGSIYFLTKALTNSANTSLWAVFFTYFSGSFGYFITIFRNNNIYGEAVFGSSQVQSSIGNPPQITVSFILLTFLYLFNLYLKKQNIHLFLLIILTASVLIVFKVYAGIVVLASLFIVGIWQIIKERKINIFSIAFFSSLISLLLYLPNTAKSASFIIFEPWWYIRTLIAYSNRLNWIDLELKRQTYLAEGNIKRVVSIEIYSFLIFFIGNLGMRFLGIWAFIKYGLNSLKDYYCLLICLIITIAFIMPMLFLQKGVAGNTIQFLHYFLLLMGIMAAITISNLLSKIKSPITKILLIIFIIILSVPTQIGLLMEFYTRKPVAKIEKNELDALNYIKNNSDKNSIILTPPLNKHIPRNEPTLPIWAWFDTAYVSAFSARRTYLADSEQVDIMGYDLNARHNIIQEIFINIDNPRNLEKAIKDLHINYLYFPKELKPKVNLNLTYFKRIFDNGTTEIWRTD